MTAKTDGGRAYADHGFTRAGHTDSAASASLRLVPKSPALQSNPTVMCRASGSAFAVKFALTKMNWHEIAAAGALASPSALPAICAPDC